VAGDGPEACALALKAGVDVDLWTADFFLPAMKEAYRRGLVTMADIDRAVGRILLMKFESGMFDHPLVDEDKPAAILGCAEHREVALEAARQSLVLLSNPRRMLPIGKISSLAVIGPNADSPMNQLGDYTAPQRRGDVVTVLEGVRKLAAGREIRVSYAKGCKVRSAKRDGFAEAIEAAKTCDATVLVLGGSSAPDAETGFLESGAAKIESLQTDCEYEKDCGEGFDRASLRFGGRQIDLLREIKALGKPLVVVLIMGRPLVINEVLDRADAVLLAWYPGMMGGQAVAEALFGQYNPGGKLTISFPLEEGQLPVYYNARKPRPNYIDLPAAPRLSFGYGLSYTTFAYSDMRLSKPTAKLGEAATVSVRVKNTGALSGDEVVQLYITDRVASVVRPERELRGFRRVHLAAGETQTVTFSLSAEELGFYNPKLDYVVEPGRFTIAVGGSLDSLLTAEFVLRE
jgi:beta-glucosidase